MNKVYLSELLIGILSLSSLLAWLWGLKALPPKTKELRLEVVLRIRAWWLMSIIFLGALWGGTAVLLLLFLMISSLALHEYTRLIKTRDPLPRILLLSFIIIAPVQYYLININWYGLFSIFIPVYGFLIVMVAVAFSPDRRHFLERVAKIHWGLMTCVYLISHAPALLIIPIIGFEDSQYQPFFYLIVLTALSDVFQFCAGKAFGRHKIVPNLSPNKTVEGLIGGMLLTALTAWALGDLTPCPPYLDALVGGLICLSGFLGGISMSAVKRDYGCKDFGNILSGHGGILDRVDSLCFSAPLFFHFIRYFYTL